MIEIVACTDNKFVMPTGVMIFSVCVNNKSNVFFHIIIDESVTLENKQKLVNIVESTGNFIEFYLVESSISKSFPLSKVLPHISKAAYYRLFLSDILPKTLNKVLYLDGDIICRGSLLPLWDIDLQNYAIAASYTYGTKNDGLYKRLNISPELGCFNSGVLLINLEKWREDNVIEKFVEYITENSKILYMLDQDVLNYIFRNCKLRFPIKYNLTNCLLLANISQDWDKYKSELEEARKNPVIVHYAGGKPWAKTRDRYPHPFRSLWFKYAKQTCWADEPLWESRPLGFRIKKAIGGILRKLRLVGELKPNGTEYIEIDPIE